MKPARQWKYKREKLLYIYRVHSSVVVLDATPGPWLHADIETRQTTLDELLQELWITRIDTSTQNQASLGALEIDQMQINIILIRSHFNL